jgi:glycine/D-amino acid oxidase-like deaminating enzyme
MRVAVIGAGVVGAAVARELALGGAEVTVFEAVRPGWGTSSTTFAWVNSHAKQPESYHRLNVLGCEAHRRLAEDVGTAAPWFFPVGNAEWAEDGADRAVLEERVARLQAVGYASRWVDREEFLAVEPDVRLPAGVDRVALFPEEGYVLPALLLARLLGEARDRGARLRVGAPVEAFDVEPAGVRVRIRGGGTELFDSVVCCVGRWTPQLTASGGSLGVPMADPQQAGGPAVGYLAYTGPLPVRLTRLLTTPRINVRPDGGGRFVLQGLDLDATADPAHPPTADGDVATALVQRLGEILTGGELAGIESVRVGQRALPADGLTVAGRLPGHDGRCYVVATHSGITLGPLLGRLAATEIAEERESPLLAGFRPDRFDAGGAPTPVSAARRPGEQ